MFSLLQLGIASASHNSDDHTDNMAYEGTSVKQGTTNSDLAFWGNRAYAGNYDGFRIIDITDPTDIENPANVIADVSCPGPQNDISVWDSDDDGTADLLFLSVDSPRWSATDSTACGAGGLPANFTADQNAQAWEGVRIFDISDETSPVQIAAVPTDCGSHTHTLIPGEDGNVYLYVSSYPTGGRTEGIAADDTRTPARAANHRNDGTRCLEPHNQISIIKVPLSAPATADDRAADGTYANVKRLGLPSRQNAVTSLPVSSTRTIHFRGCHDISAFTGLDRAFGACWREGLMWDTTDPFNPRYLRGMTSNDVDLLFHSVTVSWDGKVIAFEDESGGGGGDRCHLEDGKPDRQGAMLFYDRQFNSLGYFKIPRNVERECTAHNYTVVPTTNGRYVLASAWYTGGTSMIDFTDTQGVTPPFYGPVGKEVGRYVAHSAPNGTGAAVDSDTWSSYWYNGYVYASDGLVRGDETLEGRGERGVDVFSFNDPMVSTAQTLPFLNPQTQMDLIAQTYRASADVSLAHDGRAFRGAVSSWRDACEADRTVVIKKYRPGRRSTTVGTTTTASDGSFSLAERPRGGTFFAVVRPTSV
ncbi:MAG: hypothetical protein ACLGHL_05530, partial [Actinomycetota bacterium]